MAKMCESCGMPLRKESDRGKNQDGTLSSHYCAMCYADGAFLHPDATAEQMREYSIKGMTEEGNWPKWLAKFLTKNTHKLPRWQEADTSKPATD
jgi:hypothetical protein